MKTTRHLGRGTSALLACSVLIVAWPAHATIHKCTDASGHNHYQDSPCPATGKVQRPAVGDVAPPPSSPASTAAVESRPSAPAASLPAPDVAGPGPAPITASTATPTEITPATTTLDATDAAYQRIKPRHPGLAIAAVVIGVLLMIVSWIMALVAGFGCGALWGLFVVFFSPLAQLIFGIFEPAGRGQLKLMLAGWAVIIVTAVIVAM